MEEKELLELINKTIEEKFNSLKEEAKPEPVKEVNIEETVTSSLQKFFSDLMTAKVEPKEEVKVEEKKEPTLEDYIF